MRLRIVSDLHLDFHADGGETLGHCRIVCNPFGYARVEENKAFRPDFEIQV